MHISFLPCDALHCTVFVIVILSVRLSVTLVDCVHTVRPTIMIFSPYGSPIILVSGDITISPKFEGGHPERAEMGQVQHVQVQVQVQVLVYQVQVQIQVPLPYNQVQVQLCILELLKNLNSETITKNKRNQLCNKNS